jgi:hypothetical protein
MTREMSGLMDGKDAQAMATFISIEDHIAALTPSTGIYKTF